MMPYQELAFKPGSKFSYSNPAFIYLARVIEKVSGLSYQTYIERNILTPLGMTHTYFNLTPSSLAKDRLEQLLGLCRCQREGNYQSKWTRV